MTRAPDASRFVFFLYAAAACEPSPHVVPDRAPSPSVSTPTSAASEAPAVGAASAANEALDVAAAPSASAAASSSTTSTTFELRLGLRCGIGPGDSVIAPSPWPGESKSCRALDDLWTRVKREERSCHADSDCALVVGTCESWAVNRGAASKYRKPPCEQPTPRTCSRPPSRAVCSEGCCVPAG